MKNGLNRVRPFICILLIGAILSSCEKDKSSSFDIFAGTALAPQQDSDDPTTAPAESLQRGGPEIDDPKSAILQRGTGVFTRAAKPPRKQLEEQNGNIVLNFMNASIPGFLSVVLGSALQLDYIIDPKVKGSVTVQTNKPIPRSHLLPTVESILRLNGLAIVRDGRLYKIVPLASASEWASARVGRSTSPQSEGFAIQIVPLRYVSAADMEKVLRPLAPKGSVLKVDSARNMLILAGTGRSIRNLLDVVDIFDVDWLEGMSFGLFPIQFADAKTMVEDLSQVFGKDGESPVSGLLRFVPIERLNAVMVITQRPSYLERARDWIAQLDQSADQSGRRVYVYRVRNAEAAKLAPLLTEIFAGTGETGQTGRADGRAGDRRTLARRRSDTGDTSPQRSNDDTAPNDAAAARPRIVARRDGPPGSAPDDQVQSNSEFRIIADEDHNALIIMATPDEYRKVILTLRELDVIPLQVLVEVTIVAVTLTDDLRYGVQWFFDASKHNFTLSEASSGAVAAIFPGFSYIFSSANKRLALNMLSTVTEVRILSSPQLLVLDNQTATLQVGDQVPVATRSSVSVADADAPVVSSIQFRDTGVILKVTPRINPGGLVLLEVEQEVSDVVSTVTSEIDSPTIQQRKISTTVAIQSGESVALGGLIRENRSKSKSGIPFLKDLPLIGNLFGSTSKDQRREELLVILTPRVVTNRADARRVTEEMRERLEGISKWMPRKQ